MKTEFLRKNCRLEKFIRHVRKLPVSFVITNIDIQNLNNYRISLILQRFVVQYARIFRIDITYIMKPEGYSMKKETREEFRQLIEERIKNRERVGFFNSIKTKIVFLVFVVVILTAVICLIPSIPKAYMFAA